MVFFISLTKEYIQDKFLYKQSFYSTQENKYNKYIIKGVHFNGR